MIHLVFQSFLIQALHSSPIEHSRSVAASSTTWLPLPAQATPMHSTLPTVSFVLFSTRETCSLLRLSFAESFNSSLADLHVSNLLRRAAVLLLYFPFLQTLLFIFTHPLPILHTIPLSLSCQLHSLSHIAFITIIIFWQRMWISWTLYWWCDISLSLFIISIIHIPLLFIFSLFSSFSSPYPLYLFSLSFLLFPFLQSFESQPLRLQHAVTQLQRDNDCLTGTAKEFDSITHASSSSLLFSLLSLLFHYSLSPFSLSLPFFSPPSLFPSESFQSCLKRRSATAVLSSVSSSSLSLQFCQSSSSPPSSSFKPSLPPVMSLSV